MMRSETKMTTRRKSTLFREMLNSAELEFCMEAHSGLSARIVEEAGFKGIWASGLTMSAQMGVRDSNEASWTQVLETIEFMADVTSIPIMLDGDTGYGNFNNFRRLVRKLEQRDVAAVCIEDKLFPKTNSFIGEAQPLAEIEEFCGKIKAGKDSQANDDFSIIARVEALISGWGMTEALKRAEAYREAGADGILIHSKQSKPDEILSFAKEWAGRSPLIIVPTTYYATPTERFREADISLVIWANHNLRAAVTAMQQISRRIYQSQSLLDIEGEVASVKEIFRLAGNSELEEAENRYLTKRQNSLRAIILAASRGADLDELTRDKPKCMIDVQGRPLLHRLIDGLNAAGVRHTAVVRGYKADAITAGASKIIDNPDWQTSGEALSLYKAKAELVGDCVVCFGDVLVRKYILDLVIEAKGDIVLVVDGRPAAGVAGADPVVCATPYSPNWTESAEVDVLAVGRGVADSAVSGRWIGLTKFSAAGAALVREELEILEKEGVLAEADTLSVLERLIKKGHAIKAVYIEGHWLDVNAVADLVAANRFLSKDV